MRRQRRNASIRLLLLWACSALAALLASSPNATAATPTCKVGAYLEDLYELNTESQTIKAEFWLWSLCPRADLDAVRRFEFVNASGARQAQRSGKWRGKSYWSQVKVDGTFRIDVNLDDYPFDDHVITFVIEEGELNEKEFRYAVDSVNSSYNQRITLGGFRVTGFRVATNQNVYDTNFGDPALRPGKGSRFSQILMVVRLSRTDVTGFIKLTSPAYIAAVAAFVTFALGSEIGTLLATRMALLGTALFTTVINIRATGESLGTFVGVTLIDRIHLLTMAYVLIAIANSTAVWIFGNRGDLLKVKRWNLRIAITATTFYIAANVTLLALAIY
ncbi:hypothetical protein [Streptomyces sp. NPDC055709]